MSLIEIELIVIYTSLNWIKSMFISIQGNTVKTCLISATNGEKVISFLLVQTLSIMNRMVIPLCAANELSAFLDPAVTFNTDYIWDQLFILTFNTQQLYENCHKLSGSNALNDHKGTGNSSLVF